MCVTLAYNRACNSNERSINMCPPSPTRSTPPARRRPRAAFPKPALTAVSPRYSPTPPSLSTRRATKGASMRDLSRASGMSLAGLYYYFESKEKLLYLIQRHTFTTIVERLRRRLRWSRAIRRHAFASSS